MTDHIETAIIGAGHCGLAVAYCLTRQGSEHVVIEQGRVAETWRSKRWDSFHLVTPSWHLQLPGFRYQGDDPDGFLSRAEIVEHLEQYAELVRPSLRCGVRVNALRQPGHGDYVLDTTEGPLRASNVVIATGAFQLPRIPRGSARIPGTVVQLHSSEYRNPQGLPEGAVLVVGNGQSGCQIAEELNRSGREVYLSVGSCGRVFRRYRGKDVHWWSSELGMLDHTADVLPSPAAMLACNPSVSGADGGHEIDLRQLATGGVHLLGRFQDMNGNEACFASNLQQSLDNADALVRALRQRIDEYVSKIDMEIPVEPDGSPSPEIPRGSLESPASLDILKAGISTVVWATGYGSDYGWVRLPIFDDNGAPIHQRGVTRYPGLYFMGLSWQHKRKSALLIGAGEDAEHIAQAIGSHTELAPR